MALDLSNAFGTMLRDPALRDAARVVPELQAYLAMFLERDTKYRFIRADGEATWLRAPEGAEQGDVWGPILYSLALRPCVAALEEDLRAQLRAQGWSEAEVSEAVGIRAPHFLQRGCFRQRTGPCSKWEDASTQPSATLGLRVPRNRLACRGGCGKARASFSSGPRTGKALTEGRTRRCLWATRLWLGNWTSASPGTEASSLA